MVNMKHITIKKKVSFKMKLSKPRKIDTYYSMGSRYVNSILATTRMRCSQLKVVS